MAGPEPISRARGALLGLYIGDALAMPVHWYYDREALVGDYGRVTDFLRPKNPHPDSILWRSSYSAPSERGEILHDQAKYWGRRGVHYHQFLRAGENTLTVKLCSLLIDSLRDSGRYDPDDWLRRYIDFLTTPGRHEDTYLEECHREFFANYAKGKPPRECAAIEKHIGGLAGAVPLAVFYRDDPVEARRAAREHVGLTHRGPRMLAAVDQVLDILLPVLRGADLRAKIEEAIDRESHPFFAHPFKNWLALPDLEVIGRRLSPACYIEDSVPAVFYLALKYHADPEAGLVANTMAGGDNVHRGALLGALLGAANGEHGLPDRWRSGLLSPPGMEFR